MKAKRERVPYPSPDRVEAVVDLAGKPLVYEGGRYRSPDEARELAAALLFAADRAETIATDPI